MTFGEMFWPMLATIASAVLASSGFWAFLQRRESKKGATTQLMLGLAHDRIVSLGMKYIKRGYIEKDEYQYLMKYFYIPYSKFGGNGLADKVMEQVKLLPFSPGNPRLVQDIVEDKDEP